MTRRILVLIGVALLVMTGCATGPHFEKPQMKIAGVELLDGGFSEQHLRVRVKAHNPNTVDLPIRSINYTLELGGEPLGQG